LYHLYIVVVIFIINFVINLEKVYEGLFAGTVPVYRGTNTIYNFMPSSDSFINANNMTPEELASLLTSLSSNEEEYNKFMRFKNDPIPKYFEDVAFKSYTHPNAACRICDYANEMRNKTERNKVAHEMRNKTERIKTERNISKFNGTTVLRRNKKFRERINDNIV